MPPVRPQLRALLALLVAVPVAFAVGFLLGPDPTGLVPVALALVLTVVLAPTLYRVFSDVAGSEG
jgi:uncharacterized membrane protein YccC